MYFYKLVEYIFKKIIIKKYGYYRNLEEAYYIWLILYNDNFSNYNLIIVIIIVGIICIYKLSNYAWL